MIGSSEEVTAYFNSPEFQARENRRTQLMAKLHENGMDICTAMVAAGDLLSAEEATERVKRKEQTPLQALNRIGSYAKFEWAIKNLTKKQLFKRLPYLWMSSDPNDSDPKYLKLWKQAFKANGNKTILYSKPLPDGQYITVYRGQLGKTNLGISWTTDIEVARKFSLTGGGRSIVTGGVILTGVVDRKNVLAHITERGESEVITDPKNIKPKK